MAGGPDRGDEGQAREGVLEGRRTRGVREQARGDDVFFLHAVSYKVNRQCPRIVYAICSTFVRGVLASVQYHVVARRIYNIHTIMTNRLVQ